MGQFSEIKLTRACDGIGLSGICTSQITFSVPQTVFTELTDTRAAPVIFSVHDSKSDKSIVSPTFYVNSRTCKNGVITFTCLDRMAFADAVSFTAEDFSDDAEYIRAAEIIKLCADKLKLSEDKSGAHGGMWTFDIPIENVIGKTVSQLLTEVSAVIGGYFYISNDNGLRFNAFGTWSPSYISVNDNTAVDVQLPCNITGYELTDSSGNRYMYGDDSGMVAAASAPYASQDIADAVGAYITTPDKYTAAVCDMCILGALPELGGKISFGGGYNIIAHNIDITISGEGIYGSISAPEYSEGEIAAYMGRITRQLEQTVKVGDIIGNNMLITRYQGIQFVAKEEQKIGKYGFAAKKGGLVKFDGVMCDSKAIKQITVDRAAGVAIAEYEDGSKYTVTASITDGGGKPTITDITDKWERGTS